ncbi:MAG: hypothetical protein M1823_003593 [Watsoniomyces obsoletus]|nr:MAG: hypothetical protein M1823_003593 [Watsoniomyces obsoletus]
MKIQLALLSTLLWRTTFASPFASPQEFPAPDSEYTPSDSKEYVILTRPQAIAAAFGFTVGGAGFGHLLTKAWSKRPGAGNGESGTPVTGSGGGGTPGTGGGTPGTGGGSAVTGGGSADIGSGVGQSLEERLAAIDRERDALLKEERKVDYNNPEQQRTGVVRLSRLCVEAKSRLHGVTHTWDTVGILDAFTRECDQKYGVSDTLPPPTLDLNEAIATEIRNIANVKHIRAEEEWKKAQAASSAGAGDGEQRKKEKPSQMSRVGKNMRMPLLSVNQRQVEQWRQNVQQGGKDWGNSMKNPAIGAQILNSIRSSAQRMPKSGRISV